MSIVQSFAVAAILIAVIELSSFCRDYIYRQRYKIDLSDFKWYGVTFLLSAMPMASINSSRGILIFILVTIWAMYNTVHGLFGDFGEEEATKNPVHELRFDNWVNPIVPFFRIYVQQTLLMLIAAMPIIVLFTIEDVAPLRMFDIPAIAIWIFGFAQEVMNQSKGKHSATTSKKEAGKETLIQDLLSHQTRNPLMWWSLWLLALPAGNFAWTVISPITITLLHWKRSL